MMNRAYKFRIYPTDAQKKLLSKTFGCCRFIYNRMLDEKICEYRETGKMKRTTPAIYKKEFPWLKEVDSLALANVQLHLESAYKKFFVNLRAVFRNLNQSIKVVKAIPPMLSMEISVCLKTG